MTLHALLDHDYKRDGDGRLRDLLRRGADPDARLGAAAETALHVAVRRRRLAATRILLAHGVDLDARTAGGKTAYAHAVRRGFDEIAAVLVAHGADPGLNDADRLAVSVVARRLGEARSLLAAHPEVVHTGNPEEDRLLADVAGRASIASVALLVEAGADLSATGLDGGTALHQAAWFGQPANARLLVAAGAPLEVFDATHHSSPLGWAAHGSRHAGGAEKRARAYVDLARLLLAAGARLHDPEDPSGSAYYQRLLADASPGVAAILRAWPRSAGVER